MSELGGICRDAVARALDCLAIVAPILLISYRKPLFRDQKIRDLERSHVLVVGLLNTLGPVW